MSCDPGEFCGTLGIGFRILLPKVSVRTTFPSFHNTFGPADLHFGLHESPIDQGIINECFKNGHEGFLVVPQYLHGDFACVSETALDSTNLKPSHQF
jgi:hypothetical protein